MSEPTPSIDSSSNRLPKVRHGAWEGILLFICLAAVLTYVGYVAVNVIRDKATLSRAEDHTVASAGLRAPSQKSLSDKFTDKQGRLLADPPASPDQLINPDTVVVAHIAGADETPGTSWLEWEGRLAQMTGKEVVDQAYDNSADQIAAAASGKVTLLALHAADAPFLVNNYGFQPLAALGNQSGINGNRLDLIVSASSSIAKPADMKGHSLVCTVPSSITGYRAAIAVLMQDLGLRPNVDYEIIWSLGQKRSITGVAEKKYEAAAVSDEKLQSLLADGSIDAAQIKIIYQCPVIPRTTIGCFYNLNPALADQLRQAILALGGSAATTAADGLKFLQVDYKRDFQFVRMIDDQFDPRFNAQKTVHAD
ncbi:MAG: PhnD/SsuA/transferrin family substrate-binding protein [Tepidisphaeraceae bacterium]